MAISANLSRKRKFVADGVFYCELSEFLRRELAEDGFSGVEVRGKKMQEEKKYKQVRVTPQRTEVIIKATRSKDVLGEGGRRIRELTSVVQKRFGFPEGGVELYAERVSNRGLSAIAQAESLRYKLVGGLPVRRACYGVIKFVMESEAKGVELIVAGKVRGQRAKAMKFADGYMKSSGDVPRSFVSTCTRHVYMRQGVLGLKVKIMLDWDPTGNKGPTKPQPDVVTIYNPKE